MGEKMEYPIFLDATMLGAFSLNWDAEKLPEGWQFMLEETSTGRIYDLAATSSLEFTTETMMKAVNTISELTKQSVVSIGGTGLTKSKVDDRAPEPVFILTINPITVGNEDDLGIPREVELYQNYPNPFNPTSVIRFGVPTQSEVQLEVFDLLGRKVMTLIEGEMKQPGRYNVPINARALASGMYFYRLVVADKVLIKKMTLIK
jgi:hypothetical protein